MFSSVPPNVYAHGLPKEKSTWSLGIEKSTKKSTIINL